MLNSCDLRACGVTTTWELRTFLSIDPVFHVRIKHIEVAWWGWGLHVAILQTLRSPALICTEHNRSLSLNHATAVTAADERPTHHLMATSSCMAEAAAVEWPHSTSVMVMLQQAHFIPC